MEFDEKIHTHLMSVWRESKSFFGVGGKEGMLLLTDNHLIFLKRTERMKKWWGAASKRQIVTLLQNKNTIQNNIQTPLTHCQRVGPRTGGFTSPSQPPIRWAVLGVIWVLLRSLGPF